MNGGALSISADWTADGGVRILCVRLERPPIARLFVGMTDDELLAAVPLLYSLCAQAQRAAAACAIAAARDAPLPEVDARSLWRENLRERLWRLCLDWPAALGQSNAAQQVARAAFVAWRKRFDESPQTFDEATAAVFEFLRHAAMPQKYLTPVPCPLISDAQAVWQALRKNRPYPVTARGGNKRGNRGGYARIQTARGILTHRLTLDAAGRIARYQITAPTDRHFADAAALTACLASERPADFAAAKRALACAVLTLDPCVPHQMTWLKPEQDN